uniref:Uncharacterized protein n=1 Tax=Anguilla anguilla TaxID=7936 RepID=A0A0E9PFX3_ANGAN
MFNYCNKYIQ